MSLGAAFALAPSRPRRRSPSPPADELPAVTAALREVDRDWLRARYDRLGETDYGQPLDDEVFEAVWTTLQEFRDFYARLAERGAAVVFTVTD